MPCSIFVQRDRPSGSGLSFPDGPAVLPSTFRIWAFIPGRSCRFALDLPGQGLHSRKVTVVISESCAKCASLGPCPAPIIGPGPGRSFPGGACHARSRYCSRWQSNWRDLSQGGQDRPCTWGMCAWAAGGSEDGHSVEPPAAPAQPPEVLDSGGVARPRTLECFS